MGDQPLSAYVSFKLCTHMDQSDSTVFFISIDRYQSLQESSNSNLSISIFSISVSNFKRSHSFSKIFRHCVTFVVDFENFSIENLSASFSLFFFWYDQCLL